MNKEENIQQGYKYTPLGWIPEEWEIKKILDVAEIKGGFAFDSSKFKENGKYQVIKMSNLYEGALDLKRSKSFLDEISDQEKESLLKEGDIVVTLTGTIGKRDYGYSFQITQESNLLLNQRVAKIVSVKVYSLYLYYEIKTNLFLNQFFYTARGGTGNQANVGTIDLCNIKLPVPPLWEQKAIATILSTWDKAIDKLQQLITQKEQRKKWLIQQLLSGKKRLKGFDEKWKHQPINSIAKEIILKNRSDKELIVLSCTKYDGLVSSLEYFGRKIFSNDLSTYKIAPRNTFAYATNHIEEGSIGYQENYEEALISPMYTVFKTSDAINDNFLFRVLKSHNYIHEYQKRMEGSIDRRGGLRWDEFSKIKIPVPSLQEQIAIADMFQTADKEIQLLNNQLAKLKEQKKGLMEQLLTGKKRVKTIK